jgi:hypothetical protein
MIGISANMRSYEKEDASERPSQICHSTNPVSPALITKQSMNTVPTNSIFLMH